MNKISDGKSNSDVVKQITINGNVITTFIDSGSQICLIRKSRAKTFGDVEKCTKLLAWFAGGKYVCNTKINTSLEIDGNVLTKDLYIVDDNLIPEDVLLGRDILCRDGNRFVFKGDECWIETDDRINVDEAVDQNQCTELKQILR